MLANNKIGGALEMKMPKNENNNLQKKIDNPKEKFGKNKKVYIALGACLVTVCAVAWSTYQSVNTFISPFKNSQTAKSEKFSKNNSSDIGKKSILSEDDKADSKSGKSIPYGKQKETKSNFNQNLPERLQPVSTAPKNFKVTYPTDNNDILKEFSNGNPIYSNTMGDWRSHEGVDFKAEIGGKVKSISDGTVKDVYTDASYGTTVVIEHDLGFTAYYSGLDEKNLIEKGKKIKAGEEIGLIGKIPCEIADPAHLHLAVYKNSKFIDPISVLGSKIH